MPEEVPDDVSPAATYRMGLAKALQQTIDRYATGRLQNGLSIAAQQGGKSALLDFTRKTQNGANVFLNDVLDLSLLADSEVVGCINTIFRLSEGDPRVIEGLSTIVEQAIQMDIAARACETIEVVKGKRFRFWELMRLIRPREVEPKSHAFLQRVSRCYLFGFDPECVIMCRSALDTEFEAAITATECARFSRDPNKRFHNLDDRMWAARKLGRISYSTYDDARGLKDAANRLVHASPTLKTDALAAITKTLAIIRELCGNPSKGNRATK